MERGRITLDFAKYLLFFSFLSLTNDLRAQCPSPPKVRLVACGTAVVKLVFDDKQPVAYDSHWVSWGDGNIEQLFPRLKAANHTYTAIGPHKITVWGTLDINLCKSDDVLLDYNPAAATTAKSTISEFKMLEKASGELTIKNPSNVELLLYRKSGSGDWESTGRTISKDNEQLKVFTDSLAATCFHLEATDTCLAERAKSDPVCSGVLSLNGLEKSNELIWKSRQITLGAKFLIKKDDAPWRDITAQSENGKLPDEDLICGREHCYQLLIVTPNSRFVSLPVCRRTPATFCGAESPLFVPDAFSPNGDGINDFFVIKGEVAAEFELTVFSAWGTVVFHSRDITQSWDGKLDGASLPPGYYAYRIRVNAAGSDFSKAGSILILE